MSTPADPTVIRFPQGNPTEDEIAAVVAAVLLSRGRAGDSTDGESDRTGGWAGYWRRTRRSLRPGPDAWRLSLRP